MGQCSGLQTAKQSDPDYYFKQVQSYLHLPSILWFRYRNICDINNKLQSQDHLQKVYFVLNGKVIKKKYNQANYMFSQ